MATLAVSGDQLEVRLSPWEKVGAFHGDVRVPLPSVTGVETLERPFPKLWGGLRVGTSVPRVIALGTWRRRGAKDFVAVYRDRPAAVVHLRDSTFDRLIISMDEPGEFVAQLTRLLAAQSRSSTPPAG